MILPYTSLIYLLILSASSTGSASPETGTDALTASGDGNDTDLHYAAHGPYNIYNCGRERASELANLLDELQIALRPAIHDSMRPRSSSAFKPFFKQISQAPFVATLLTNVLNGTAKTEPFIPESPNGSPVLYCLNATDLLVSTAPDPATGGTKDTDWFSKCNADEIAFYPGFVPPRQFIVICEAFWMNHIPDVPTRRTCASINRSTNLYRGSGQNLKGFRMWIILEELAHYYIYTTTLRTDAPDVYDINECVGLSPEMASLNAPSYVYYVASEYSSWHVDYKTTDIFEGIYSKCRAFPILSDDGRELLGSADSDELLNLTSLGNRTSSMATENST